MFMYTFTLYSYVRAGFVHISVNLIHISTINESVHLTTISIRISTINEIHNLFDCG